MILVLARAGVTNGKTVIDEMRTTRDIKISIGTKLQVAIFEARKG